MPGNRPPKIDCGRSAGLSDFCLLRNLQGVVDLNTEVTHGALELCVPKKKLHSSQVFRPPIYQCRLRPAHRVSPIGIAIQPNGRHPAVYDACILARGKMGGLMEAAGKEVVTRL